METARQHRSFDQASFGSAGSNSSIPRDDIDSSVASSKEKGPFFKFTWRTKFADMPSCMNPQFVVQEQPLPLRVTTDTSKTTDSDCASKTDIHSIDTSDIVKDQATMITSLQGELYRERSLIAQYRDEWDSVRSTLQAARRQNETLVKERDLFQKQAKSLQSKVSLLEAHNGKLQREIEALTFVSQSVNSDIFPFLPALQPSLKEVINKVGPYSLERDLRKGESGTVVTVFERHDKGAKFAMKVINKSKVHDWEKLQQLDREVGVLQKLHHANIVQIQKVLHGYRALYLVMEHWDLNLRQYQLLYAPSKSSTGWIKQAMIGVTQALAHLHASKIAHMNVTPENIVLVGVGRSTDGSIPLLQSACVRLSGFESCAYQKDIITMHKEGVHVGAIGYFAPDMYLSRSSVDGTACDMWSLGSTLLSMTTGFCEGWMASYEHHASDIKEFEKGLSKCLRDLQDKDEAWYQDADLKNLLVDRLLVLPTTRATAEQVLRHSWLSASKVDAIWV